MIKILFMADLHLKIGQKNVPKEWAINRYNLLIAELRRVISETGGIQYFILGGDTFDKVPSMEELEVFFNMLYEMYEDNMCGEILIYSGNHEATRKGHTFLSNLKSHLSRQSRPITVVDEYTSYEWFDILPYNKLHELSSIKPNNRVLFSHARGDIPPHVKAEVDLELFGKWDTVFLGDLHSRDNCQRNMIYPGSPVSTSFHREFVATGVELIELDRYGDNCVHQWVELNVPQLLRRTVSNPSYIVKTEFHHTVYELEGSMEELSKLTKGSGIDNSLLDKKLVRKISEPKLDLSKATSIEDELAIYLREVLGLPESSVVKLMSKLNDNTE